MYALPGVADIAPTVLILIRPLLDCICNIISVSVSVSDSVSVSLEIHYKYGDENSYKLVAKPITKNAPFDKIESEWVDREALPLGKVSKFVSNKGGLPTEEEINRVRDAFNDVQDKLNQYNIYPYKRERLVSFTLDKNNMERVTLFYLLQQP